MSTEESERLRLLESVVGNAKDAVVLTDFDANGEPRIVFVNPAFTEQTGYSAEDAIGRHPRMLVGPESDFDAQMRLRRAATERVAVTVELTHYRADGSSFVVENSVNPIIDGDGNCTHLVSIQRDITERKRTEAEIAYRAAHDALTQLPNRSLLADRLNVALTGLADGRFVTLLVMDLDRFKAINDTLGHEFGDQVLQVIAERMASAVRVTDTVARLGGDEFGFVLPDVKRADEGELVAAKLLLALEPPIEVGGISLRVDASVGVAMAPVHGTSGSVLMQRAETAMYRAKKEVMGYAVYVHDADEPRRGGLALMVELRRALEAGELTLHYQPVVTIPGREVVGLEALARWEHPERGLLGAEDFIPLAEETGVIGPFTEWLLEAALAQLAIWHAEGWPIEVAVNVSGRLVADRGLPDRIIAILERTGAPAASLTLEVTESAVMVNPERALAVFTQLAELGVALTLDDFGTGYSSLTYLKRLPARQLKIDRSFIVDMLSDEKDASIVRAVIDLGHNLGLRVVAEGVEDEATFAALANAGCDLVQGFLVGRPVPAASAADMHARCRG